MPERQRTPKRKKKSPDARSLANQEEARRSAAGLSFELPHPGTNSTPDIKDSISDFAAAWAHIPSYVPQVPHGAAEMHD